MKICKAPDCFFKNHAKGYCTKHYQRFIRHGNIIERKIIKGGNHNHPLYSVYFNILARCYNTKNVNYKYYGGKGIKMCDRWKGQNGFIFFTLDMGERPNGFQIDRIDVNGNYEPNNCRWVNKYVQMANTTNNNLVVGVAWYEKRKKWRARIKIKGEDITLGYFTSFDDAFKARSEAYKQLCLK